MSRSFVDYVVFIHRYYDKGRPKLGGLDYVVEYLISNGKTVLVVESPLFPKLHKDITVRIQNNKEVDSLLKFNMPYISEYTTWAIGVLIDIYMAIKYSKRGAIVLSSDPLTSLPAVILRKLGYFSYHYYHCVDYSDIRFKNGFMNMTYKILRTVCFKFADSVGCVSQAIFQKVNRFKEDNIFVIPNSPEFDKYKKYYVSPNQRRRDTIVMTCMGITPRYMVIETIQMFENVFKKYPKAKLEIIGSIDADTAYFAAVQKLLNTLACKDSVTFIGHVNRDENVRIIGTSAVGLCFYNPKDSFAKYADSLKIREYAATGLPVVADTITGTAIEMQESGAGFSVKTIDAAAQELLKLLQDDGLYHSCAANATKWAQKNDKNTILRNLFENVIKA